MPQQTKVIVGEDGKYFSNDAWRELQDGSWLESAICGDSLG